MAYSAPVIHAVGDILTASDWNISSNDISFLAGTAGATIATSQTGSSNTYADLATVGPSVTVTTGANALVTLTAGVQNNTALQQTLMGFNVGGATTISATDTMALSVVPGTGGITTQGSATFLVPLTVGSNTFTAKYRVVADIGDWLNRTITVQPLP